MHDRTKKIKVAILRTKRRDGKRCRACYKDRLVHVHGAHILPRNVGFKRYDPANEDFIITLCRDCHMEFDRGHSAHAKIRWLRDNGLEIFARRLEWIIGNSETI